MPESLPAVVAERALEGSIELDLSVTPDLVVFEGHFDDHPIVPGIAEVDWALKFARPRLPVAGEFTGLAKTKFSRVIQPPARLTLTLSWQPGTLAFAYRDEAGACSSGELCFSPAA